jgi:hypothetical protein
LRSFLALSAAALATNVSPIHPSKIILVCDSTIQPPTVKF